MSTSIGRRAATVRSTALIALASGLLLVSGTVVPQARGDASVDVDGDGFAEASGDCGPLDPSVGPHASDVPDLDFTDTDCDGVDGDAAAAVFVAPDGSDANPGTQSQPVQTLTKAVALAASGGKQVYAAVGTYPRVTLSTGHDGVRVYGGYERGAPWTRTTATPTIVQGQPEAMLLDGATDVVLQLLDLRGTRGAGLSAYGVRAINGSEVALTASSVSSGPGGAGATGDSGTTPVKAANGDPGDMAPNCDTSGTGGVITQLGNGTDGGAGGRGGEETNDGENGQAGSAGGGSGGGAGGAGGTDTSGDASSPSHGVAGAPGATGAAGGAGSGGANDLAAAGGTWAGRSGGDGTNGGAGYGGGGGGGGAGNGSPFGWGAGSGGGQGGDGGAGGTRGFGGGWGGGSIGVYLHGSQALILDTDVTAAAGGAGGAGGTGGAGGQGGTGGPGAPARTDCGRQPGSGGPGGQGGTGGAGGNGGGGSGGPSAAVMRIGTSNASVLGDSTLAHGAGGVGGGGGLTSGQNGQSAATLPPSGSVPGDFDADSVTDPGDDCPTLSRGTADADGDGCPEPPETTVTSGPREGAFVLSRSATVAFASSEGGSTFTCSLDDRAGGPCDDGSLSLTGLAQRTHHVRIWARDGGGDADPSAAERSWTVPLSNTALAHGKGWAKKRGSGYYLGTYSQATRKGATLSTAVADVRTLALVATRGKGFGTVKVFLGSQLLKKVELAASRTRKRQVVPVASFAAPRSGRVKIVVATAGKTVRVEGLGVATE